MAEDKKREEENLRRKKLMESGKEEAAKPQITIKDMRTKSEYKENYFLTYNGSSKSLEPNKSGL